MSLRCSLTPPAGLLLGRRSTATSTFVSGASIEPSAWEVDQVLAAIEGTIASTDALFPRRDPERILYVGEVAIIRPDDTGMDRDNHVLL